MYKRFHVPDGLAHSFHFSIFAKLHQMQFGPDIRNLGKNLQGLSEEARWVIEKPYELSEEGALTVYY